MSLWVLCASSLNSFLLSEDGATVRKPNNLLRGKIMAKRNPNWTEEELVLALDLYFRMKHTQFTASNKEIIKLSETLKELKAHPNPVDPIKYRNPNGVSKKLSNFLRLDPTYKGTGLIRGSRLDEVVWNKYVNNKKLLDDEVKKILRKIK